MAADKAREIVQVTWSDAMAVAGHLFEPVPELYPPRYRAVGLPDADTWSRLRTKAVNQHIKRAQRDGSSAHESEAQSQFVGHGSGLF
jgi:hypothetical protein